MSPLVRRLSNPISPFSSYLFRRIFFAVSFAVSGAVAPVHEGKFAFPQMRSD